MLAYTFHRGSQPLLISVPHAGTAVPEDIERTFTAAGRGLGDTDWYVDQLYEFVADMGISIVTANYSRYVVDLNRAPDSTPLYTSSPTSPVCPTRTFSDEAIYEPGTEPDGHAIAQRIEHYWRPYHQCVAEELWRIRSEHGYALLWDAHSIVSRVPTLFTGELPAFNFGTRDGLACPRYVADELMRVVQEDGRHSCVLDGRFKGGYITMVYGKPADRVFAVQLELAQRTYMEESPRSAWDSGRAQGVRALIGNLLEAFLECARR